MDIYIVGGYVRDKLLDIRSNDRDFVVVGSTVTKMLSLGYKQVGKDFPVFLHPKTKEQYALARAEKKITAGYTGFSCNTSNIGLKQDLSRRDLTINAMAIDNNGNIIDYFNGAKDLKNRVLRHISISFKEDPVRILRIARFMAKFNKYNFTIANDTKKLMLQMANGKELDALVGERVFTELKKTLNYNKPSLFFQTLVLSGAFKKIFKCDNIIDFTILDNNLMADEKFALWLINYNHRDLINICSYLKIPNNWYKLTKLSNTYWRFVRDFNDKNTTEKLNFYLQTKAINNRKIFKKLLTVFNNFYLQTKDIERIYTLLQNINNSAIAKNNPQNIKKNIYNAMIKTINNYYKGDK